MIEKIKQLLFGQSSIDRLIKRIDYELKLDYYDSTTLRKCRKWAKKYSYRVK